MQKGQYRYIKLHTNHKTIYVGDWNNDDSVPTIEELEPRVQVPITNFSGAKYYLGFITIQSKIQKINLKDGGGGGSKCTKYTPNIIIIEFQAGLSKTASINFCIAVYLDYQ